MKCLLAVILILAIILIGPVVVASDVSNAQYLTTIRIENSGTALTNAVAVVDLSTPDMIDNDMLDAQATKAAMLTGIGGTDIVFMPGANATNPWCTMVTNIGAASGINQYLYTANVTGGLYRYFPAATGMKVNDSASLEPADNTFDIEIKGWFATSASAVGSDIQHKYEEDQRIYVSAAGVLTVKWDQFYSFTANMSSGAHTLNLVRPVAAAGNVSLYIDGVLGGTVAVGAAALINNASDWYFCESPAMLYVEYVSFDISGVNVGYWDWDYGATFADQSGCGNTATPSFRTTASDPDITSEIVSQTGLITASTPVSGTAGGWTMIGSVPSEPAGLFDEGGDTYGIGGFNIGELVTDAADDAGQDATSWHILLAFGLAIGGAVFIYKVTNNTRLGQRGSLLMAAFAAEIVLIMFYTYETIPGLALIPFALIGLLLVVWRKSPAPVD